MTNGQKIALFTGGGVALAGVMVLLRRYAITSYGENPWSLEAFINVIRLRKYFEAVKKEIDGTFTSVYRSEKINNAVPGSSKTSDHMNGAAIDIAVGKGWSVKSAVERIHKLALEGKLGDVAQIIEEYKSTGSKWVHVGWNHPKRDGRKLQKLVLLDSKPAPANYSPA